MNLLAAIPGLLLASLLLGGCVGGDPDADPAEPRTWTFDFRVDESTGSVEVYTKNDGTPMRIVAAGFMLLEEEELTVPNAKIDNILEGDTVVFRVENTGNLPHTVHLHGWTGAWEMDGVDYLTQFPIMPGENFTYTYKDLHAGTYFYHCHVDSPHHQDLGMYGAFIVKERSPKFKVDKDFVVLLDEMDNCHVHQNNDPLTGQEQTGNIQDSAQCYYRYFLDNLARNGYIASLGGTVNGTAPGQILTAAYCDTLRQTIPPDAPEQYRDNVLLAAGCGSEHAHGTPPPQQAPKEWWFETHPVYAPTYNTYVMNGKAFPDTPVFKVREGETARFRLVNAGDEVHSMHWHGHKVLVTHKDLYELPEPYYVDTLALAPGERYEVVMEAGNPGLWMFHDHVGLHMQNDDQHPGGIMACIAYVGWEGVTDGDLTRALDCNTKAVEILEARHGPHMHGTAHGAGTAAQAEDAANAARPAAQPAPSAPQGSDRPSAADFLAT